MKNMVKPECYYFLWELGEAIDEWVCHYNHERYHESLDTVAPAAVYEGRRNDILDQRALVKARTMTQRKIHNLRLAGYAGEATGRIVSLRKRPDWCHILCRPTGNSFRSYSVLARNWLPKKRLLKTQFTRRRIQ